MPTCAQEKSRMPRINFICTMQAGRGDAFAAATVDATAYRTYVPRIDTHFRPRARRPGSRPRAARSRRSPFVRAPRRRRLLG
jgi:hypothetical protein